jgi:NADPH:quinone reductase-like Zn-dependent oxidoreductase
MSDRLSIEHRNTPEPGSSEILIEIKDAALNPVDYCQRDFGMPLVPTYPAVVGSDTAGIVAKAGTNITSGPAPSTRVLVLAPSFYHAGSPDHGAFQQYEHSMFETVNQCR